MPTDIVPSAHTKLLVTPVQVPLTSLHREKENWMEHGPVMNPFSLHENQYRPLKQSISNGETSLPTPTTARVYIC